MYLRGVKHEKSGEVVEAIRFYKRAMQLVPDIEERIYTIQKNKGKWIRYFPKSKWPADNIFVCDVSESSKSAAIPSDQTSRKNSTPDVPVVSDNNNADVFDDELPAELFEKFNRITSQDGRVCTPLDEPKVILHVNNNYLIFYWLNL